jgi:muconolactone delta-isomerase
MEFLVSMTTQVPAGTSTAAVDDIRSREARRARELAAEGTLLRLWRPPLKAGEWRTLGLFAARDGQHLEQVLASMPLRVWRTDEVMPLDPHPNDPGRAWASGADELAAAEFLTTFRVRIPEGTAAETVTSTLASESTRARELAEEGHLRRLWLQPAGAGPSTALGLWRARDATDLRAILDSLPMDAWLDVEITPLSEHPSDPQLAVVT